MDGTTIARLAGETYLVAARSYESDAEALRAYDDVQARLPEKINVSGYRSTTPDRSMHLVFLVGPEADLARVEDLFESTGGEPFEVDEENAASMAARRLRSVRDGYPGGHYGPDGITLGPDGEAI